ncbi:hypothetical protein L218DRAFT_272651 [Marasmius fiardii PR-910]|nr:hypothetical protein L218DRAFT_272651 [Marasmius fiardii PR-910]
MIVTRKQGIGLNEIYPANRTQALIMRGKASTERRAASSSFFLMSESPSSLQSSVIFLRSLRWACNRRYIDDWAQPQGHPVKKLFRARSTDGLNIRQLVLQNGPRSILAKTRLLIGA